MSSLFCFFKGHNWSAWYSRGGAEIRKCRRIACPKTEGREPTPGFVQEPCKTEWDHVWKAKIT
jgi:hypothetical protein